MFIIGGGWKWCTLILEFRGHMGVIFGGRDESLLSQIENGVTDHICIVSLVGWGGERERDHSING